VILDDRVESGVPVASGGGVHGRPPACAGEYRFDRAARQKL